MSEFAVIRAKAYAGDDLDLPPSAVFEVERETPSTLFGKLLTKGGRPLARDANYDREPEASGFKLAETTKFITPGRVKAQREIARHPTFDAAMTALRAAQAAWDAAEDQAAYRLAAHSHYEADKALSAERKRLHAEVEEQLAELRVLRDAAATARTAARKAMFERMSEAARLASLPPLPTAEEGR